MSDWLHGVRVPPLSIQLIRDLTNNIRRGIRVQPANAFPVLAFLEHSLPQVVPGFDFEIVDDLPDGVEARAYPDGCEQNPNGPFIQISRAVYEAACEGDGRARLTILHEIAHVLLHRKVAVHHRGPRGADLKAYENSEWQANCFAAELLMTPESFLAADSLEDYCRRMGVSRRAALVQGRKLITRRELPPSVSWLE